MSLFVHARLQRELDERGAKGARWLADLPGRIGALEEAWGFRVGPAFDHSGAVSWVAPVALRDGSEAVLKIGIPHEEARWEAEALCCWDGRGAVRLLQASEDGFSLLLERCIPGTDLWPLPEAERDAAACAILPRIWRAPEPTAPFISVADAVAAWWAELGDAAEYDPELVTQVKARAEELVASQPRSVLLHGDFHPGNVLSAQRERWLVIDPKPLVGDPAYDLAQWLGNCWRAAVQSGDPVGALRRKVACFANDLALDPTRIAGWAWVKALGWDWGPEVVTLFRNVAEGA